MDNNYKKYVAFFKNVMFSLGYYDWTINFCEDNYCWLKRKRIDVALSYRGDIRQIILHEIAHINTAIYCNQTHNPFFWKYLSLLTRKFLKKDIDEYQKEHRKYMSQGHYGLCYEK